MRAVQGKGLGYKSLQFAVVDADLSWIQETVGILLEQLEAALASGYQTSNRLLLIEMVAWRHGKKAVSPALFAMLCRNTERVLTHLMHRCYMDYGQDGMDSDDMLCQYRKHEIQQQLIALTPALLLFCTEEEVYWLLVSLGYIEKWAAACSSSTDTDTAAEGVKLKQWLRPLSVKVEAVALLVEKACPQLMEALLAVEKRVEEAKVVAQERAKAQAAGGTGGGRAGEYSHTITEQQCVMRETRDNTGFSPFLLNETENRMNVTISLYSPLYLYGFR